jgi:hypothetical protein
MRKTIYAQGKRGEVGAAVGKKEGRNEKKKGIFLIFLIVVVIIGIYNNLLFI